jgi:hypothetical protein
VSLRDVYELIARLASACRLPAKIDRDAALAAIYGRAIGAAAGSPERLELVCEGAGVTVDATSDDGPMWSPPSATRDLRVGDEVMVRLSSGHERYGRVTMLDAIGIDVGNGMPPQAHAPSDVRKLRPL